MFKILSETHNFIVEIKEKDLHSIRSTVYRELETIFSEDTPKLLNVEQHEIIALVD